jgi:hypothetical protein
VTRVPRGAWFLTLALVLCTVAPVWAASRLSDEPKPLDATIVRPRSLLELGEPFLNTGPLSRGWHLPGGAVWQPSFLLFGTYRNAVQTFDDGKTRFSEWAHRLDVFGNLQLTGTERVLIGLRPFDRDNRTFSYELDPEHHFADHLDGNVEMVFFEGELGELLPNLDPRDKFSLDYGFSVGRQPLVLQDGILMNDIVDSVGIVRNSLHTPWTSGLRLDFFHGWGEIHRNDNRLDPSARLYAVEGSADVYWSSMTLDLIYLTSKERKGDGFYGGYGAVQRVNAFGQTFNATVRVNGSYAVDHETPATGTGVLFFTELSRTPNGTLDLVYLDAFWAIEQFSSAARGPEKGGALGRTGILFEAFELGRYGPPVRNDTNDAAGASLGYQRFFDQFRRQVILEVGGRKDTGGQGHDTVAVGGRIQQAVGSHVVLQADGFIGVVQDSKPSSGARGEFVFKF